jgi:hypothetical protein
MANQILMMSRQEDQVDHLNIIQCRQIPLDEILKTQTGVERTLLARAILTRTIPSPRITLEDQGSLNQTKTDQT